MEWSLMHRRAFRFLDHWWVLSPIVAIYVVLWALPASVWFNSRSVTISDAPLGAAPLVLEDRQIRFSFYGHYLTTTRNARTHDATPCKAESDFPYRGGLDGQRTMSLTEWSDGEIACAMLPPDSYYTQTCRTVLYPLWGILPAKTTCNTSNIFKVTQ